MHERTRCLSRSSTEVAEPPLIEEIAAEVGRLHECVGALSIWTQNTDLSSVHRSRVKNLTTYLTLLHGTLSALEGLLGHVDPTLDRAIREELDRRRYRV
jgi:hypothetical protein